MTTTSATTQPSGRSTGAHAAPGRAGEAGHRACTVAATATGVAGVLHGAAAAAHLGAGDIVVGFFGLTALGQGAGAVALMVSSIGAGPSPGAARRRTALLAAAGAAATTALVCLYVVVHGTDLLSALLEPQAELHSHGPAGAGHPTDVSGAVSLSTPVVRQGEPVDALGTATVAVELLALAGLLAVLPAGWRRAASNGLLVLAVAACALWLSGLLG